MSDDFKLKLVKTNEREEDRQVQASKYSSRYITKKVKVHDMELHHPETGEPIFTVHPQTGYGSKGKYDLKWHSYMTDQYPDLEHSHEFGSRHYDREKLTSQSGKDYIPHTGTRIYREAARAGFKDPIPHTVHPSPTESDPTAHTKIFRDPDTNDPIVSKYPNGQIKYHGPYMDKNNIDRSILDQPYAKHYRGNGTNHFGGGRIHNAYEFAKHIYSQKGQTFNAIGNRSGGGVITYSGVKGKSDEDLSRAHEENVKKRFTAENYLEPEIHRHSPTIFQAKVHSGGIPRTLHSIVHEGRVTEASHDHDYQLTNSTKISDKF